MKLRSMVLAFGLFFGSHQVANAACSYQGVSYAVGSKLCFGGWLQECTVANYWKAIGMCRAPDKPSRTSVAATSLTVDGQSALSSSGDTTPKVPSLSKQNGR